MVKVYENPIVTFIEEKLEVNETWREGTLRELEDYVK